MSNRQQRKIDKARRLQGRMDEWMMADAWDHLTETATIGPHRVTAIQVVQGRDLPGVPLWYLKEQHARARHSS